MSKTEDPMGEGDSLLLTDLYQLTMLEAYRAHGLTDAAVFELFMRKLPARRGFLVAAGLEQAVEFLEGLYFKEAELEHLRRSGRFPGDFVDWLAGLRFSGDVDALPEGTIFFADEPLIRVTAPLPQAQIVETRLINLLHFETLIASKAARMVLAAPGRQLVDFSLRRTHGAEAGLLAARASYLAGFSGTATVLAAMRFGIPVYGTMAHSFIQAHDDEMLAFEHFAHTRTKGIVLLIDTYDTERGARRVVALAERLAAEGIKIGGVRIDSGDLAEEARKVRKSLDEGGCGDIAIFASGGLDEDQLAAFTKAGVPIDGYGIGTSLGTSSDVPALDCAYKLQEYAGLPRRKRSAGKATWPGRKQIWRRHAEDGRMAGDLLTLEGEIPASWNERREALLQPVMRGGKRVAPPPTLAEIRLRAAESLRRLPKPLAQLEPMTYPVEIGASLRRLAEECDRRSGNAGER
jgi:nicotinate phosphoribosyltransferase